MTQATETQSTTKSNATDKNRVPTVLARNSILADFCGRYLDVLDRITEYNKTVLAEKDAEWTASKVLSKAKELGHPESGEPNADIKTVLDEFERIATALSQARKAVIDTTSKVLGISLSAVADRDPEQEKGLKEDRKLATEIGTQLSMIAKMTNDEKSADAVTEFLAKNPLPAIGRDQVRSFGTDGASTPKYRVSVTVTKDGNELLNEKGFTKTALKLTQPVFGYERGKAPKADDLRKAWESAGNTPEKTVKDTVEFEDNKLHFVITKN